MVATSLTDNEKEFFSGIKQRSKRFQNTAVGNSSLQNQIGSEHNA